MNSSLRIAFVGGTVALMAGSTPGATRTEIAPSPVLSVRLSHHAQVPAGVLRSATVEVTRLFRTAGILISWEQPSAESPEDQGSDMTASVFRQPDARSYLVVRLMRRTPATVFPGALGFALPFAHSGAHVLIFYDRVETLTQRANIATEVILGHAMAHEIGHVLLGSSEHSRGGLMSGRWDAQSWRLASEGLLAFRLEEAERMSAGLSRCHARRRVQEHEPTVACAVLQRSPE